ncbi:hypothetical protein U8C32_21645 (plasmid) [Sinorhizobium medicae]|uniref:hypothetical protein n=1 Tax=Sinorhizobium medicae TaxID=110321 RepID=UPI002AF6B615|nr:hypothetical protein [Sinorhizobium medicae]WQO48048.1 hypothetical protein U8C42_21740 [Sinorhizobium medicae]WQO68405.1 hypothetical protein U8C40_23010 [Sinorhizobium medicae]WQO75465.1 hypothetical protein U8C31_22775 [Sinorhizobium medicae]WQO94658.1 hypothetical protein U8C32_21645 [Sinorhizobium medicae]
MKITGLDKLSRQLKDAEKAISELDGQLGTVTFTPDDPASIENAIHQVEAIIDERVGRYASNPFVAPLIEGLKEQYREGIIGRAAAARIKEGEE